MEELLLRFNLFPKKLRGKDEFEIFKNYMNDVPNNRIENCFNSIFKSERLEVKNDPTAAKLRMHGNIIYDNKDYQESIKLFTKSLCYATLNGKEYALALGNRSAAHFAIDDYKNCIKDIDLCLQANYPNDLKPKVYIRKAKCLQKLGESAEMRTTLMEALNLFDSLVLSKSKEENYKEMIQSLVMSKVDKKPIAEESFGVLPEIEPNPTFLNASASVMLKFNKRKGVHVVAKKEIARGEVLFVEKAYSFVPYSGLSYTTNDAEENCQYCLVKTTSCIPCKVCVKTSYCTQQCRDDAWKEFHQWECLGIQADIFHLSNVGHLAFRTVIKAVNTDIFAIPTIPEGEILSHYGDKENNYPYIYNLPTLIDNMKRDQLTLFTAFIVLIVHYLKLKTNFFKWMKELPIYANKSDDELMNKVGGLITRHGLQIRYIEVKTWDVDYDIPFPIPIMSITAIAMCPSIATMNHSCLPNTVYYFVGDTVVVKAINNIKVNEEINYSFTGVPFFKDSKAMRQKFLQDLHFLKCNCRVCIDPRMETRNFYVCIQCKGPALPLVSSVSLFTGQSCVCVECNLKFTLPASVFLKQTVAVELLMTFELCGNVDYAIRCFETIKTIYGPYNRIFDVLFDSLSKRLLIEAELPFSRYRKMLLECLAKLYGDSALITGVAYYGCCMIFANRVKNASATEMPRFTQDLEGITEVLEKARVILNLHYPVLIPRLQKVEKKISELRMLTVNNKKCSCYSKSMKTGTS